jgi:hypothetical protein
MKTVEPTESQIQAFFDMLASEPYRAIGYHRTVALDDSRLVTIAPGVTSFQV